MTKKDYFDGRIYRKAYHLNMFLMSLNKAECRKKNRHNEAAYLNNYPSYRLL